MSGIYSLFWQLFGKEVIKLEPPTLKVQRRILLWKRTQEFAVNCVQDLRVIPTQRKTEFVQTVRKLLGRDGKVAFDCDAKIYRLGVELNEAEAQQLISIISQPAYGIYG